MPTMSEDLALTLLTGFSKEFSKQNENFGENTLEESLTQAEEVGILENLVVGYIMGKGECAVSFIDTQVSELTTPKDILELCKED